jgi:hypothetical protein
VLIRSCILYAFFSKLEFMKTVVSGKAEDHAVYSVSLPFIFFTYILLTSLQVVLGVPVLRNPIALFVIMSLVIYLTKLLCRRDSHFDAVEERYQKMSLELKNKVKIIVYSVDLISFTVLCLSIYTLKISM